MTPEQEARQSINARLAAAGWAARSGNACISARCALQQVDRLAAAARPVGFCSPRSISASVCDHAVADVGPAA